MSNAETMDGNVFADQVPTPGVRETGVANAMEQMEAFGRQFAEVMRGRLMPIDEAVIGTDDIRDEGNEIVRTGERLPVWVVLADKDLSGRPMFGGQIGVTRAHSHSIWSGTPNDFRTDYEYYNSRNAFEKGIKDTYAPDHVSFHERAIGLDAAGRLIRLSRAKSTRHGIHDIIPHLYSGYAVSDKPLMPDDLFDVATFSTPDSIAGRMQARLSGAIRRYAAKKGEEDAKLLDGEVQTRPHDYYTQHRREIFRYPNYEASQPRRRKLFGRR